MPAIQPEFCNYLSYQLPPSAAGMGPFGLVWRLPRHEDTPELVCFGR